MTRDSRHAPRKTRPRIACPAELRQAASESAGDTRREKRLNVVEAASGGGVARDFMESEKLLPAAARSSGRGIVEQIRFRGETLQDGHSDARGMISA